MPDQFIILNLERMIPMDGGLADVVFWNPDSAGYTRSPFEAGVFTKAQLTTMSIAPDDIVVPVDLLTSVTGFQCSVNSAMVYNLHNGADGGKFLNPLP